ncbi:MAG TPA: cytochrome C [Geobacteraceae bacterium]
MTKRSTLVNLVQTCCWGIIFAGMAFSANEVAHHGSQVSISADYKVCLTCHDGVVAPRISPCLAQVCMLKSDHPVGRPYPPPGKEREYASAALAESAGIKFIDGRIDCISCHDLNNPDQFHLRIEEKRDRLCRACHLR